MQTIENGYRAFGLLMTLNWDRVLYLATMFAALAAGSWLFTLT